MIKSHVSLELHHFLRSVVDNERPPYLVSSVALCVVTRSAAVEGCPAGWKWHWLSLVLTYHNIT